MQNPTLLSPLDFDAHPCGYCGSKSNPALAGTDRDTSHTYGAWAHQLNPADYRALMDRGWRRSGAYLYKPHMSLTCCPQYTIRLPVLAFKPSKQHRQVVNKVKRYIGGKWVPPSETEADAKEGAGELDIHDGGGGDWEDMGLVEPSPSSRLEKVLSKEVAVPASPTNPAPASEGDVSVAEPTKSSEPWVKPTHKRKNAPFNLREVITELVSSTSGKHVLHTTLELASNTPAKFALYDKYQTTIHRDAKGKNTSKSFARFLVDSPLNAFRTSCALIDRSASPVANGRRQRGSALKKQPRFGSFHLCYYLDDRLVGVSVIDIVPGCVSSVYFFYDPDIGWLGLGKLSAMVEMVLALEEAERERQQAMGETEWWLYMGYYVPACTKMIYKAQFKPSELMDPVNYRFYTIDADLTARLNASDRGFARFDPSVPLSVTRDQVPDTAMDREVSEEERDTLLVLVQGRAMPMGVLRAAILSGREQNGDEDDDEDDMVTEMNKAVTCAKKMDKDTAKRIVFTI
ncbi:arginine-tRNA-protein transferase [Catenaria anguillulae PL171]|uniref:Arginyl-tRNA--protein transferase 1 n=1 Tax=Catenaria anguillulae PL171 TaxID=765915 RepID=A0A1Y2I3R1_9FUNG|nr:arginine-tRNA-protein transferase [Catenaria anguillulae PL171]